MISPSKKTLAYMRRMISSGSWKPNERIPTLGSIAKTLKVSIPTIRKALKKLEYEKTIQNYDSLGFFVLSDALVQKHKRERTSFLIHMSSVNLDVSKMEYFKRKLFGQYGIGYNPKTRIILAHNIITHKSITTTVNELDDIIRNPITIKKMLEISNDNRLLARTKTVYQRQQRLLRLARVVNLNKRELGIIHE